MSERHDLRPGRGLVALLVVVAAWTVTGWWPGAELGRGIARADSGAPGRTLPTRLEGTVLSVSASIVLLRVDSGRLVTVDVSGVEPHVEPVLRRGRDIALYGKFDSTGVLHARTITLRYQDDGPA